MAKEQRANDKSLFTTILLIALALVCFAYWNAPQGGFVYDDQLQVVRNPLIQNKELWVTALTSDVWAFKSGTFETSSNYYRPVFTAWSIGNFVVFGLNPMSWHVANILLHMVVVWLALRLLLRLGFSWSVAAVTTWIFAAHPVHVESVTWIAGSPDLLMAAFLLGSLEVYIRNRKEQTTKSWMLALGLMFLAVASKESALMMAPVVFMTEWVLSRSEGRTDGLVRGLRSGGAYFGVVLAFFVLRTVVLGGTSIGDQSPLPLWQVLLSVPQLVFFYVKQALLPFGYSTAYPLRAVSTPGLTTFWVPLAVTLVVSWSMLSAAKKQPRWAVAAGIALFILPAFYIRAFFPEHVVRDRYLYLPLLGVVALLVDFLVSRGRAEAGGFKWGFVPLAGLSIAVGLGFLCTRYNEVWRSDVAMWTRGVETDADGSFANMQLAEALRVEGHPDEAIPYAERAAELNPEGSRPLAILGLSYKDASRPNEAESAFKRSIATGKDTNLAAGQLADLYLQQRRFDEAIAVFEAEIGRNPAYRVQGTQNIASLYVLSGRSETAVTLLESLRKESPGARHVSEARTLFMLGQLYLDLGNEPGAKDALSEFLSRTASSSDAETRQLRDQAQKMLDSH